MSSASTENEKAADQDTGQVIVRQLEEGASYWQPVPANGFSRCLVTSEEAGASTPFSMGTQTVSPGGYVRAHSHDNNEEVIFFMSGRGRIEIDDGAEVHQGEPGTMIFLGKNRRHSFINDGDEPLTFAWFFMPGGLDKFFAQIGRPRTPGEPAPEPFARPENVKEIEAKTVFGSTS